MSNSETNIKVWADKTFADLRAMFGDLNADSSSSYSGDNGLDAVFLHSKDRVQNAKDAFKASLDYRNSLIVFSLPNWGGKMVCATRADETIWGLYSSKSTLIQWLPESQNWEQLVKRELYGEEAQNVA